jgi:hypothetical protein
MRSWAKPVVRVARSIAMVADDSGRLFLSFIRGLWVTAEEATVGLTASRRERTLVQR